MSCVDGSLDTLLGVSMVRYAWSPVRHAIVTVPEDDREFVGALRGIRMSRGIPAPVFAREIGIATVLLSRMENDGFRPPADVLNRMRATFDEFDAFGPFRFVTAAARLSRTLPGIP